MNHWRLIRRGLSHHARAHLAVALGVVAGTAVLTGALLVGDSVRGSLRGLTLERLGRIDSVLVVDRFFRTGLADELAAEEEFRQTFDAALPAILLRGSLEEPGAGRRANQVDIIGCDERFWSLGDGGPARLPGLNEVVLNRPLAEQLQVDVGDEVIVRFPQPSDIPADSALGRKSETVQSRRLEVVDIVSAQGLGRFGLRPNQQLPQNAFVDLATLQSALDVPEKANAILVAAPTSEPVSAAADDTLNRWLQPRLADYGLRLEQTDRGYLQLTSQRMLLEPAVVDAAQEALAELQPHGAFTYLANEIRHGERSIPYSTITALELASEPPLGPFRADGGDEIVALEDDEILLNDWAADDLGAQPGDEIELTFFEPESTHGEVRERTATFRLRGIVPLDGPAGDADFTPELKGVTDEESIADWDPPFPFEAGRIRSADEEYWDTYRATPKAFISLSAGQALWGSRFGRLTLLRMNPPPEETPVEQLATRLELDPEALGFDFQPVKRQGLQASAGTTPFNALFLGFSFFLIASALMLVVLLFRLGVENRAAEVGLLAAVGWSQRRIQGLLLGEGLIVAVAGAIVGVGVGVAYAWLMLAGLRTFWLAAVTTPFLQLHVTLASLLLGGLCGAAMSVVGQWWALRQMKGVAVRRLLDGQIQPALAAFSPPAAWSRWLVWGALAAALVLALFAGRMTDEAQAGAFFGSGALVLTALLTFAWRRLRGGPTGPLVAVGGAPLPRLAVRNSGRNPGRTTLSIGLVASASFLIVAISAFRLDPPETAARRDSGTGGFALIGESDQPIYQHINDFDQLGLSTQAVQDLDQTRITPLPVRPGDDASCLNLYQPGRPRVVGVTPSLIERGGFSWGATAAETPAERDNPWLLLNRPPRTDESGTPLVPVIIDQNTAIYSLHLYDGVGARYSIDDGRGGTMSLVVVGLLKNSLFQGDLLVGEAPFREYFPDVNGYRLFLVDAPEERVEQVEQHLERAWGDYGWAAERTTTRLAGFFAVQNTYLSTFQSLGGLGLLLGTFGLAVVELRNVLERRGELALLRATGFRRARLAVLVLWENALLLLAGLAVGIVSAAVAVVPHFILGQAQVPWLSLVATLGLVAIVGLVASLAAVRAMLVAPLLPALRGD